MLTELERDLGDLAARLRSSSVAVRSARGMGAGSGVVWPVPGTIVTNAHVAMTSIVEVEFADGRVVRGQVDRRDEHRDLARVRVEADGLTPAAYRDPGELRLGDFVAAFGNPLGIRDVLSTGIVFATHRTGRDRFVRADVKILPGNSGGALADAQGRVVGINSMVAGGLALAVPTSDVLRFLGEAGAAIPVRLGVRLVPARLADGRTAHAVIAVEPGSVAEQSGIIIGDLLVTRDLAGIAAATTLHILRGGVPIRVPVARSQREAAAAA
jgi:serine protease Do